MAEGSSGLPARRFRDDEVAVILARAASKESRGDLPTPHDPTLEDLMAAAAEAGLDPSEVRRAAAVAPRGGESGVDRVLGGPHRREVTAVLPGSRIPTDPAAVARCAEAALGVPGVVVERGPGRFAWRADGAMGRSALTLEERDGAVELSLSTERGGHYLGIWFLGLLAWAALMAVTPLGALPALGKLVSFLVTPVAVAYPFRAATDRRVRARQERAALDILRLVEERAPAALPRRSVDDA